MADRYFDLNGSTAGFGTLTGAWNTTSAFWSTSSAGTAIPGTFTFTSADRAFFGATGATATAGTATIADGVTITLNNITTANLAGLQTIARTTSGALTLAGTAPSITVNSAGGLTVSAPIGGTQAWTANGSGTLTLTATNSFSSGMTISSGVVQVGNNAALGTGTITMTGGKLSSSSTTGYNLANALTLNDTMTLGDATNNGALTLSGTTTIAGTTTLSLESGNFMTLSGAIAGTGAFNVSRVGSNIVGLKLTGPSGGTSGPVSIGASVVLFQADYASGTPNQLANAASITHNGYNWQIGGNTAYTYPQPVFGNTAIILWNVSSGGITFNDFSGKTGGRVDFSLDTAYSATQKLTIASSFSVPLIQFIPQSATQAATQTLSYTGPVAVSTATQLSISNAALNTGVTAIIENASSGNLLTISGQASNSATSSSTASTLRFATTSGDITYSGNIVEGSTGTLNLSKTGSNTLTLSGAASTYKGTVSVNAGTLNANSVTALGAATSTAGISVTSGATLSLGGSADITYASRSVALSGTGVSTAGALVVNNAFTNRFGGISLNADTLIRATESGTLRAPFTTNNWFLTLGSAAGKTLTLTSDSTIGGTGNVIFGNSSSTGVVAISAQNTYTGNAAVLANYGNVLVGASSVGTVASITSGPFGRGSLTWGGTIDASVDVNVLNATIFTGDATFGGTNRLTVYGATSLGASRTITVNGSAPLDLAGVVSGIGYKITKAGAGTLILSNTNTYSGGTDITAGVVSFWNGGLGSSGSIGMLGGTLQWAAGNTQDISSRLSLTGGVAYFDTNANDVSFGTPYTTATGISVYKLGSGSLSLTGNNNWSGTFVLQAGTVYAANNGSLGTSTAGLYLYGGKVSAASSSAVSILNTGTSLIGGDITVGDAVKNGSVRFNCDFSLDSGTRTVTTVVATSFWGKVYSGNLTKAGASSLNLVGASTTYTGTTTLSAGTLGLDNNDSLGAAAASLALNGGVLADSTGNSPYTRTMVAAGASTIGGNVTFGDGLTTGTLTLVNNFSLGTSTTRTLTVATGTTQVFSGVLSGSGAALVKSGAGRLRLTGANTYGNTTVSTGTLQAGNEQALGTTGTVTLSAGTTLQTLTTGGQNGKLTVAAINNSAGATIRIGG